MIYKYTFEVVFSDYTKEKITLTCTGKGAAYWAWDQAINHAIDHAAEGERVVEIRELSVSFKLEEI